MRLTSSVFPAVALCAAAYCGVATPARAQSRPETWPADSADVARRAYADANRAFSRNDLPAAHAAMVRAANAWPTQGAYLWGETITAALAGDTAGVVAGLNGYLRAGLGRELSRDTIIARYRPNADVDRALRAVTANAAPYIRSTVVAQMADSTFWPEGVDFDPRSGSFFVASIRHGTIAEIRRNGTVRELWPRNTAGMGAVMGVRVDTARRVLWATTSGVPQAEAFVPGDSAVASLLQVRNSDGVIMRRWPLPISAGTHALGDLAVGASGDVYFTDSSQPFLYHLRPDADTLERITSRLFHSLQGLAPSRDGKWIYVADYSLGILRVELRTLDIIRLHDAPGSSSLGCDGILLVGDSVIVAVQNGVAPARLMAFALDAARTGFSAAYILDRNPAVADEPTIATLANGMVVYVANSQWDKHDDAGHRIPAQPLTSPVLLGVPFRLR